jgi:hypothetical protein
VNNGPAKENTMTDTTGKQRPDSDPKNRDKGTGPKHVLSTGLPPGISIEEALDPGNATAGAAPKTNPSEGKGKD